METTTKITVVTTSLAAETVAYFVQESTGQPASIYDVNDLDNCGWDYIEEGLREQFGSDVKVVGFCDDDILDQAKAKLNDFLAAFKANAKDVGSLDVTFQKAENVDWLTEWRKNFKPVVIGDVCICPEWLPYDGDCKNVVKLDSGIAFGTGYHETTFLCVLAAQDLCFKDKIVLDAGCGSGVLGLVALTLGAKKAVMIDLDSQAVEASKTNAALNGLTDKCEILQGDLTQKVKQKCDVCFANLTADILLRLVCDLPRVLNDGAYAVLSGILNTRLQEVKDGFVKYGFKVLSQSQKGEWSCLTLRFDDKKTA